MVGVGLSPKSRRRCMEEECIHASRTRTHIHTLLLHRSADSRSHYVHHGHATRVQAGNQERRPVASIEGDRGASEVRGGVKLERERQRERESTCLQLSSLADADDRFSFPSQHRNPTHPSPTPQQTQAATMAKRKGMSLEEKRRVVLSIYHTTKDVFNLKEIEGLASKQGVVQQRYVCQAPSRKDGESCEAPHASQRLSPSLNPATPPQREGREPGALRRQPRGHGQDRLWQLLLVRASLITHVMCCYQPLHIHAHLTPTRTPNAHIQVVPRQGPHPEARGARHAPARGRQVSM